VAAYLLEMDDHHHEGRNQTPTTAAVPLVALQNKRGSTPLLFALYGPRPPIALVERLLAGGSQIDHADHDGVGVLHVCASQGHETLLPLFLGRFAAAGLDVPELVARRDANGHDPAFYARMKGHEGVLRLLLEAAGKGGGGGGGSEGNDKLK
jgi:ankyrin repeat protein